MYMYIIFCIFEFCVCINLWQLYNIHVASIALSYSIMQCHTASCSVMQHHAVSYSIMQCHTASYSVIQCHTASCSVIQCHTVVICFHIQMCVRVNNVHVLLKTFVSLENHIYNKTTTVVSPTGEFDRPDLSSESS